MNNCKYRKKCEYYRKESYTCSKAFDKEYCGKYREFLKEFLNKKKK